MIQRVNEVLNALPPLPKTIQEFQNLYRKQEFSYKPYIDIIIQDPMLTADILKISNSSIYAFTQKIKTLDQAFALFGIKTIRSFVINYELQKIFVNQPLVYGLKIDELSELNIRQTELAVRYAQKVVPSLVDDIFIITLLSDMGKIVISKAMQSDNAFSKELEDAKTLLQVKKIEKKYVGATNEAVNAKMYKEWHLDDMLINTFEFLSQEGDYSAKVKKCALILWMIKTALNIKEDLTPLSIKKANKIAKRYNLPKIDAYI